MCSCAQVFLDRSGGILNGHVPTAEIDHTSAHLPVGAVQWSSFELRSVAVKLHHARSSYKRRVLF